MYQMHSYARSFERNPEPSWVTPTHWANEKNACIKIGRKEWNTLSSWTTTYPMQGHTIRRVHPNSQLLPDKQRVWIIYPYLKLKTPLLQLRDKAPKLLTLKVHWACIQETLKTLANKPAFFKTGSQRSTHWCYNLTTPPAATKKDQGTGTR